MLFCNGLILLLGPSGVGKTHIAIALGYAATQKRIKTKFITISDLMLQLEGSKHNTTLDNHLKRPLKNLCNWHLQ